MTVVTVVVVVAVVVHGRSLHTRLHFTPLAS